MPFCDLRSLIQNVESKFLIQQTKSHVQMSCTLTTFIPLHQDIKLLRQRDMAPSFASCRVLVTLNPQNFFSSMQKWCEELTELLAALNELKKYEDGWHTAWYTIDTQ